MLNILVSHSLYSPDIIGGAEVSTKILAEALAKKMKVHVMTVGKHNKKQGVLQDAVNDIPVYRLPSHNLYWYGDPSSNKLVRGLWYLRDIYNTDMYRNVEKIIRTVNPSVVHTQKIAGLTFAIWMAAGKLRIPVVHTLRDYSLCNPFYYREAARYFSRKVSAVIGISDFILQEHLSAGMFGQAERHVVANAIEGEIQSSTKQYHGPLNLIYFGRLSIEKGIEHLIRSVMNLPETVVGRLIICGDGPQSEMLRNLSSSDSRIEFTGKMTGAILQERIKQADLTVLPSVWDEPFGRVIIESYQLGTPVLGSHVGGIPEVIADDAFLFEAGNPQAISEKLIRFHALSRHERVEIQQKCLEHCEQYTVDKMLDKHLDLYHHIINKFKVGVEV
ncbi:glycosyltransferase family 4 protein [Paenibacillus sp. GCM10012307]|uniref:Glycosyltransferase family 4 protein n=1 Tax=Paenibacillus roseus TaxID=2798579 RepID=A0A934J3P9_9BACL|nr:glycosyltransferase family 4 protein [Paenibacillus roseus]MBJ6360261.1 glycosyltransferase family 4 protein [Paenibacillus roseus]